MPIKRFKLKTLEDELNLVYGVINNIANAVVVVDFSLEVIFQNKAATLLHGIDLTKPFPQEYGIQYGIISTDGISTCRITNLPLFSTVSEEIPSSIELHIKRPDGTGTPVSASVRPLLDQNANLLGWLVEFIDISQQKHLPNELRLLTSQLEDYQSLANIGSWSWDAINDNVHWSNQLYRIFGLNQNTPPPNYANHSKIYTPESYSQLNAAVQTALNTGQAYELDLDAIHSNGTIKKIIARGQVKRDLTGKITGIYGVAIDITERKRVDQQLQRQRDFLNAVLENAGALIVVLDKDGRICRFNHACEEATQYSFKEVEGRFVWDLFLVPEERETVYLNAFKALINNPISSRATYRNFWTAKNGVQRLIDWSNTLLFDESGKVEFVVSIGEDITETHHAQELVHTSVRRLNEAQRIAQLGSWELDLKSKRLFWSDEIFRIFEIDKSEFDASYEAFLEYVHPDDQDSVHQAYTKSLENRGPYEITHRLLMPDGRIKWINECCETIYDDQGNALVSKGTAHDITQRKLAEIQLSHYSERLRLACKAAAIGICEWDINTGLAKWDDQNYEIFGLPKQSSIDYQTWAKLVFREDIPKTTSKLRQLMGATHEIHWEFRIHRQNDGVLRYIQAAAIAGYNDNGELDKIVGINIDITPFKQIETALREKKAHLAQAQTQALLGSWSIDIVNNIIEWSDECYRIFEIPIDKPLAYQDFLALIYPEDQAAVDKAWQAAKQGERYDIQHRILVNGKIKWLRECAELILSDDGQLLRGLGTVQDITELKVVEQNLEYSRLQIRQLAASCEKAKEDERKRIALEVHDELGQMLSALRMQISLLRIKFADNNKQLLEQIHSIMELLDKTIQVTRDVATALRPPVLEMGIASALEWLVSDFSKQSGIECELHLPKTPVNLNEDSSIVVFRITQESLTNVLRHSAASRVIISIAANPDYYVLKIHDNGKGFDPSVRTKTKSFGLIGIQERALMLGGDATIDSASGNGTLIQVRIPTNPIIEP
ncbi:hypothetical protein A1359_08780 [Methylomonas lenta]|uniref:histidine kinase n=1 Tax=Methylomonas lenta TaxID=980561 RepID=A0A177NE44_9GAMM|nr:PAS domain-containing protein [Methylomonas lenta]OAI16102.1 hypothetical protein A1359_08780 [Methylomonas lenta]